MEKEYPNQIIFKLPKELKKEFNKKCIDKETSMSDVLREFVRKFVQHNSPKEGDK